MKTRRFISMMMLVIVFAGVSCIAYACQQFGDVHGNGKVVKQTRVVSNFDGLEISGAFDVILRQGDPEEVIVEADENLLPLITTEVHGTILVIDNKKSINNHTTLKVYITFKDIKKIETSGAADILAETRLTLSELSLHTSGASSITMGLAVQKLGLDCSGACKLKLAGTAVDVDADFSGACNVFAFDLICENFKIDLSGAGKAQIHVTKKIDAEISGAGSVHYKGNPTMVNQSVSGAGAIKKVE